MKIFKILMTLLLMILVYYEGLSQDCFKHPDDYYQYYVNVNVDNVKDDFNKEEFFTLLKKSNSLNSDEILILTNSILKVEKSFPTAETDFLQHSLSVYSKTNSIESLLDKNRKLFNLVEFVCFPEEMLLYQTNDYNNIGTWVGGSVYNDLLNTDKAWDLARGDKRIKIGITDTYLKEDHIDLVNNIDSIWSNGNSPNFHGTQTVGCASATTNNTIGTATISYKSPFVFSDIWHNDNEVLLMAQDPNIRVINLSWVNNCNFSTTQNNLYTMIRDSFNTVVVAGAGNSNIHCGWNNPCYPASYESVISVTSVGHTFDMGTTFTAPNGKYWGKFLWKDCHTWRLDSFDLDTTNHHHNELVNISAPGYGVYTTDWGGDTLNNKMTQDAWGTSFASPIVASACALVAATNPCLTAEEIQTIVLNTADPSIYFIPENEPYIGKLGTGRLDVYEAVKRALELRTIYIQNQTYSGVTTTESSETIIKAGYQVTSTSPYGLVRVLPNSDVTFEAPHSIVLGDGFEVKNETFFEAKIIDSPCFE